MCCQDVMAAVCTEELSPEIQIPYSTEPPTVSTDQITKALDLLGRAKKPIIYAGQGVLTAQCWDQLRSLAKKAQIPVTTTLLGMGAFDERDPLSLHMLGMHGSAYANYAMQALMLTHTPYLITTSTSIHPYPRHWWLG